jgi:hypothetical protein
MPEKANNFFATLHEPVGSCLLFLRHFLLEHRPGISEAWKFNTPFYYYKKRWLAFISYNLKNDEIYISFVNGYKLAHKDLVSEGRKKMKIFYINANKDIDVNALGNILDQALEAV